MSQPSCQAEAKRGRCRAFALPGGSYCWGHDPGYADERRAARAKGGVAAGKLRALRGRRAKIDSVGGLLSFTAGVVQDTYEGRLEPDVARVVLYGSSILRQLLEAGELEQRLARLEARAEQAAPRKGARSWGI